MSVTVRCHHCSTTAEGEPGSALPPGWHAEVGFDFDDLRRQGLPIFTCSKECALAIVTAMIERLIQDIVDGTCRLPRMFPGGA